MELPDRAARALEALSRDGRDLRFEVSEICKASRYRLSVHYRTAAGPEFRLGLVYGDDRGALEALGARLATAHAASPGDPVLG